MSATNGTNRGAAIERCGGVLFVLPEIPDDATDKVKEALAVRNAASLSGRCPSCGAVFEIGHVDALGLQHLVMRHSDDCPALLGEAS